ncbi:MAG: hypothetical protein LBU82_00555 [Treponema sp.]|jgi:hypothetical protein|nr:hypothetical protein [Treponema sp.]
MKKRNDWLGVATIFVVGMAVMGACSSTPPPEPVLPDEQSAVVYFLGGQGGSVWDGETPIGEFDTSKFGVVMQNMPWKTTPGEHFFIVNRFNWVTMRANLQANKTYYVQIVNVPNPVPFARDMVALRVLDPKDGPEFLKTWNETAVFTDEWRSKFAQGKLLQEVKENLQDAKADKSMEISLN